MTNNRKFLLTSLLGLVALSTGAFPAAAAVSLGDASAFAVLSAKPGNLGKVTCTDSTIAGAIGSSGTVVETNCTATGGIQAPVSANFDAAYAALANTSCDRVLTGTLAGVTLAPGVYCFDAAATLTGTLTLKGPSTGSWLFKVGTLGTGALTGTNFTVMLDGATACNVTWWVSQAATMTDSNFKGSILAGAAITVTRGTFEGRALAKDEVTLTNVAFVGCQGGSVGDGGKTKSACNQGVGNGPEACDPGNSNQGFPFRSNDEINGVPGAPGRQGGNK